MPSSSPGGNRTAFADDSAVPGRPDGHPVGSARDLADPSRFTTVGSSDYLMEGHRPHEPTRRFRSHPRLGFRSGPLRDR